MNDKEYIQRFNHLKEDERAALFYNSVAAGQEVRSMTIDLTTAQLPTNPKPVGFSFRSFIVLSASDSAANLNMKLATVDSFQDRITLTRLVSGFKLPYPVNNAFLDWSAQAGKTITILFFLTGEMTINRVTEAQASDVMSTIGAPTAVTLVAATAAAIFPALASRRQGTADNNTGGVLYIGDSTVTDSGATKGIAIPAGGKILWKNVSALYGYSAGGGVVNTVEEA